MMIACLDQQQQQQRLRSDADPAESDAADSSSAADLDAASEDFGGIVHNRPAAVIRPLSTDDVSRAVCLAARSTILTVAARGNGHSINGQAMANGGLVLDMRALSRQMELVFSGASAAADVPGGALWEEVLTWSVQNHRMAPASWTDYLGLTVGGTLSNGGISGQAFRRGPQISNVSELEIVTGDGECHVCSSSTQPDLFYAALGGLGQFGIITRARIPLRPAPHMVKWMRVVYASFEEYSQDAESLVTRPDSAAFDYIEGFAFVNSEDPVNGYASVPLSPDSVFDSERVPPDSGPLLYCLEVALHCQEDDNVDKLAREMLRPLRYIRGLEFTADVSYVDFLSRVKQAEENARANGTWNAPHPWLNILVSARNIVDFDRNVFKRILKDGVGGPMLVYPLLRSKWDPRTSVALPESGEIFYLVALLRFSRMYPEGSTVEELVDQNRRIVDCCRSNGYDFKLYLPHYKSEREWERHFGKDWPRFVERKERYDPMAILAPGQRIFSRRDLSS